MSFCKGSLKQVLGRLASFAYTAEAIKIYMFNAMITPVSLFMHLQYFFSWVVFHALYSHLSSPIVITLQFLELNSSSYFPGYIYSIKYFFLVSSSPFHIPQ